MKRMGITQTQQWHDLVGEPWTWLSQCFFQPTAFRTYSEALSPAMRLKAMLRICPLILVWTYPAALLLRIGLDLLNAGLYPDYFSRGFSLFDPGFAFFMFDATWASVLSCLIAGLFGAVFSLRLGIAAACALSFATGITNEASDYNVVGFVFGISLGLVIGPVFNSIGAIKRDGVANVTLGSVIGVVLGLSVGIITGIPGGYGVGAIIGLIGAPVVQREESIAGSVAGMIAGGIPSCLLMALLTLPARYLFKAVRDTVDVGSRVGIAAAGALGAAVGTVAGDLGMLHVGSGWAYGVETGLTQGFIVGAAFLVLYIISYYRLPLYPLSAIWMVNTYRASRRNAAHVFECPA